MMLSLCQHQKTWVMLRSSNVHLLPWLFWANLFYLCFSSVRLKGWVRYPLRPHLSLMFYDYMTLELSVINLCPNPESLDLLYNQIAWLGIAES